MDANHINLILDAFTNVMPQLGLNNIEKKATLKLENEQLSFLNNKEHHTSIKKL